VKPSNNKKDQKRIKGIPEVKQQKTRKKVNFRFRKKEKRKKSRQTISC